jgi:hypothetical protein
VNKSIILIRSLNRDFVRRALRRAAPAFVVNLLRRDMSVAEQILDLSEGIVRKRLS